MPCRPHCIYFLKKNKETYHVPLCCVSHMYNSTDKRSLLRTVHYFDWLFGKVFWAGMQSFPLRLQLNPFILTPNPALLKYGYFGPTLPRLLAVTLSVLLQPWEHRRSYHWTRTGKNDGDGGRTGMGAISSRVWWEVNQGYTYLHALISYPCPSPLSLRVFQLWMEILLQMMPSDAGLLGLT